MVKKKGLLPGGRREDWSYLAKESSCRDDTDEKKKRREKESLSSGGSPLQGESVSTRRHLPSSEEIDDPLDLKREEEDDPL